MIKTRLVLPVLAAAAFLLLAGCGGGGDNSSPADPASVAPAEAPVFLEGTLRPSGSLKTDIEELAKNVAGVEDLGGTIIEQLESSASDGQFNYEDNIEPWLGEKAGMAFVDYDGDNFENYVIAIQSTDTGATEDFLDNIAEKNDSPVEDASYKGVDYKVETDDGSSLGVIGDLLVFAQSEEAFEEAVDASDGKNLAGVSEYKSVVSHAPSASLVSVYVDIGTLIEASEGEIDPQAEQVLEASGIKLDEADAYMSLIPGAENIELDIVTDAGNDENVSEPATELLESMPGDSIAALSAAEYGKQLQKGIDSLDASGIPGEVPPHQLNKALEKEGIDLDQIAGSLEDVAVFAVGNSESSLGGAVVLQTKSATEAKNTVANVGLLLRSNHTPGVTAIGGKAAGFSIHNADLGRKPLVVAAKGERIAIGYGLPATLEGLNGTASTLGENPAFGEAKQALGDTPLTGFVDGGAALDLAESLVSPFDTEFEQAQPYLEKIAYVGFGGGAEGSVRTAKVIVGLEK